jgi:hypothetical protein
MAFRQKIEAGMGLPEDAPAEAEWRELWKATSSSWSEFEGMHFKRLKKRNLTLFLQRAGDKKMLRDALPRGMTTVTSIPHTLNRGT